MKCIIPKKFEDETSAIGRVVVLWACCIGTIQAVNDDGTPKLGAVYELWESYDHRAASAAAQRESDRINAEIKKKEQAQLAEQRAQKAAQKADALARVLKLNQDAANKGDSFGLMRMGERYRDGEGVEKDLTKAREYFQKSFAADTNNFLAKEALSKLDAK